MTYHTEQELLSALKEGELQRVYLLYGKDEYLKQLYADKIQEQAVGKEPSAFDLDRFDGKKLSMNDLYDSVLTLPFLGGNRCIIIDDPEFDKMTQGDHKKFMQILDEIGEGTVVLIVVKQSPFLPKKSAKCRSVLEYCGKHGGVICLDERSQKDLIKYIRARCRQGGCSIEPGDAAYLLERTTTEMMALSTEVEKLIAYSGGRPIDREMIQKITAATVDAEIFDLSKAILRGDYPQAMKTLSGLFYLREPEINILATLSYAFVDLYRAKTARHQGKETADVVAAFDYKGRDFRVRNAMRDCSRYSLSFLKGALEILADADYRLKSSRSDPRIVLEQAITSIFILLKNEGRH